MPFSSTALRHLAMRLFSFSPCDKINSNRQHLTPADTWHLEVITLLSAQNCAPPPKKGDKTTSVVLISMLLSYQQVSASSWNTMHSVKTNIKNKSWTENQISPHIIRSLVTEGWRVGWCPIFCHRSQISTRKPASHTHTRHTHLFTNSPRRA